MLRNVVLSIISAAALCAQAQLTGKFVFSEDDTLGIIEFDGKGNVTGAEYTQLSGVVPFSGTYSISTDGSGSLSLLKQATDEDGVAAPAVLASYQFLQSAAKGFSAMKTTGNAISVAKFSPVYTAKSISGSYVYESEGKSASGEARAELGSIQFVADGNLSGKQIVRQSGVMERVALVLRHEPACRECVTSQRIVEGRIPHVSTVP